MIDLTSQLASKLRQTVARGYCDDKNRHKELDVDLLNSIVLELLLALDPECHATRKLPLHPTDIWHPG